MSQTKKLFYSLLLNICLIIPFFGQSQLKPIDVFNTHKIIFYGYDFSCFRYVDAKRYGQDMKLYIFQLIGGVQEKIGETQFKKWMSKDTVLFNFDESTRLNKSINNDAVIVINKTSLPEDSVQKHLKNYNTIQKSGIGHLFLPECYDDLTGSLSVYSVFFDIETKQILLLNWAAFHDLGPVNRFGALKKPMLEIIEYLDRDIYQEKNKILKNKTK
ncbi:MAG: hypothetical protein ABIP51_21775 [Bacteroidia bacterium]